MAAIGIDIGSSTIKLTQVSDGRVDWSETAPHEGDIRGTISRLLDARGLHGNGTRVLVTGGDGRRQTAVKGIVLPVAIEYALQALGLRPRAVVSLGGEELVVYAIDEAGRVSQTFTGDKCAAGTGEFFKQQLFRMNMTLADVARVAPTAKASKLSARCSVFMKSDCTHKLNKKEATKDDIVLSLSLVMAGKVAEYLTRARVTAGEVLLIGGAAQNPHVGRLLRELLPDIQLTVPASAAWFESLGAARAAERDGVALPPLADFFVPARSSFERLAPMSEAQDLVQFIPSRWGKARPGGRYIMGVDGGSTTTKIALVDAETQQIVAAHYGRTHGDPVEACRACLVEIKAQLAAQIGDAPITITHVATTGSSREILGVFLQTPAVYNEIIAHTVGTTHFNDKIDTIFEIGGQDAKYVYLKNNVPIDYAMNEACSAGTGSFLEESASGDLSIGHAAEIGPIAAQSTAPLKFGEHCSAFINSDIRKAIQEGNERADIVAGLVYSIVSNYLNRVVGNRNIGETIVLQGGVAKNPAVALAFAKLVGRTIVVPPDPELMGCFGVALLAQHKTAAGQLSAGAFAIDEMLAAQIAYGKEFRCKACDNDCPIRTIVVGGNKYFFGGRCSKYTNLRKHVSFDERAVVDYSERRHQMLFSDFAAPFDTLAASAPRIGVPLAFAMHEFWPLFSWYFYELGLRAELIDEVREEGTRRCEAAFCFPGEIAHGTIEAMLERDYDWYFLPHVKRFESFESDVHACLCPIVQGLPYYVKRAFPELNFDKVLAPMVDLGDGWQRGTKELEELAVKLGRTAEAGRRAYERGIAQQTSYWKAARAVGRQALADARKAGRVTILVQGRPYNAYTEQANMGIPRKFASRGYSVLPMDFIPFGDEQISPNMYWYYGQMNMKATAFAKREELLFPCYVSNFSCAPDSFILHQVRWFMGTKPFLVLELDSHSADAGIDTRVEAFLDIIEGYRSKLKEIKDKVYAPRYEVVFKGAQTHVLDTRTQERVGLKDKRVQVIVPTMGDFASRLAAECLVHAGIDAVALPVPDIHTTQLARNVASGKECLPTLLTLGATLQHFMRHQADPTRVYTVLIPRTTGPCRTGQYEPFFERTFDDLGWDNVTILGLSSDNSYTELGPDFSKMAWAMFVISDLMKDAENALQILAVDREAALAEHERVKQGIMRAAREDGLDGMVQAAIQGAGALAAIPVTGTVHELKKVLVVGEIYVRRDDFSQTELVQKLAEKRILAKLANVIEWVHYTDYVRRYVLLQRLAKLPAWRRMLTREYLELKQLQLEMWWKHRVEHKVSAAFMQTGLVPRTPHDMDTIMRHADTFASEHLESEATISSAVAAEAMQSGMYDGVVAIAPFACLIGRLIKAFLNPYMREQRYPFIVIENDGLAYPLNVINQLEMFMLNVLRYREQVPAYTTAATDGNGAATAAPQRAERSADAPASPGVQEQPPVGP